MKILLDNNIPQGLRHHFVGHDAVTAVHKGWATLANGRLLQAAESEGFDLLVTLDKGFLHQHNLRGRSISVAVFITENQSRSAFERLAAQLLSRIDAVEPGHIFTIE